MIIHYAFNPLNVFLIESCQQYSAYSTCNFDIDAASLQETRHFIKVELFRELLLPCSTSLMNLTIIILV